MAERVLFAATRISTFDGALPLTAASGFFFERDDQLYLITSRHVLMDAPSHHFPNRIEIELHTDARNLTRSTGFSILLYENGNSVWRQAIDSGGDVDVAAIRIERARLPDMAVLHAFTPDDIQPLDGGVEVGAALSIIGFPLGFHDTLHHLPVARQAALASAFGIRFQGNGYFLTDARTHRGTSGAPVLWRQTEASRGAAAWRLLGVHAARMDVSTRDLIQDETLALNCAWYADILMTLTAP
ncbi:S1 family peptidase [Solimonas marina]|uniref:Trypsin-like peptidase domain-containing protein n=1 Tax=Solimonas marina TaxID=2714601 RepID=A0A969W8S9_9GAMM|nr:trypsin-like peptidase domain-containing protein [Solimonas marina]